MAEPEPHSALGRVWALLAAVLLGLAAAIVYVAFLPPQDPGPAAPTPPTPPPRVAPATPPTPTPSPTPPPPPSPPPRALAPEPRVALLIDDIGYNRKARERLLALPAPIAFAVLPEAPQARAAAKQIVAAGHDLLVHLPCEPTRAKLMAGMRFLTVDLPAAEIAERTAAMLAAVPGAVGANNHMGSRFTQQPAALKAMLGVLKQHGLFFVDSKTSARSQADTVAREQGLPVLARDLFLDDDPSPEALARQVAELERLARKQGTVIAIGHPRAATLDALEGWFAGGAGGLNFVALSDLLPPAEQTARTP